MLDEARCGTCSYSTQTDTKNCMPCEKGKYHSIIRLNQTTEAT